MNSRDFATLRSLMKEPYAYHGVGLELRGIDSMEDLIRSILTGFPDARFTIEDQFAEGDRCATRIRFDGTHTGEYMGVPATGKPVRMFDNCLSRIEDGKIAEDWEEADILGLLRQIGAEPAAAATSTAERNKAVMRRWFDVSSEGREAALAILDEVVASDYVMRDPSGDLNGREALRQFVATMFDGMSDFRMNLDDMIAVGDRLSYQFTIRGTHTAELLGFAPTGNHAQAAVTSMARFVDGKLAEETQTWDFHGFLKQISPSTEANKILVRRFVEEVLNKRDWGAAGEICGQEFVFRAWHWPELQGPAAVKQYVAAVQSICPDFKYSIEEMVAEGDNVYVRWTFAGTHKGEVMGIAPTGKFSTTPGATLFRITGGKIVEHLGYWDALGMVQQLSSGEAQTVQVSP